MNAPIAPKTWTSAFRFNRSQRRDWAFLPAALEILETPPSPIRMVLLATIGLFVIVTLTWMYFGWIDIIAVAQGKLQPTGRVKIIQPLETSRVIYTPVENGTHVHKGDLLVELDTREAHSDEATLSADLASFRAEVIRRGAAIKAAQAPTPPSVLETDWPSEIPAAIRARENRVFAADMLQLSSQLASLAAQIDQKGAERDRLATMIASQAELIATLRERVAMRHQLVDMNAGSKANLIDATETLQFQQTTLAQQKGQLAESTASIAVLSKDMRRARDMFVADTAQKLAEAERQVGDLSEKREKARRDSTI